MAESPFRPMPGDGRPVMPEDMEPPKSLWQQIAPHAMAFGAGAANPFGVGSYLAPEHLWSRRLEEMRAESPFVADVGSFLTSGGVLGKAGGMAMREIAMPLLGLAGNGALFTGHMRDILNMTPQPQKRAQGGYGHGGAY